MGGIPNFVEDHATAAIVRDLTAIFAWKGETLQEYWWIGISFELILVHIWLFYRLCCSAVELELRAQLELKLEGSSSSSIQPLSSQAQAANPSWTRARAWPNNKRAEPGQPRLTQARLVYTSNGPEPRCTVNV
jgi:hypothetical protein